MADRKELTLSQLTALIKETIDLTFSEPVWVIAEISRATFRDHVYLDLVEKAEGSDTPIAQMRATIWRSYRRNVVEKFELLTGQAFSEGLKVLVNGYVSYHPRYGLSLDIRDIDPYYTLGDLYRRRQEVIHQLKEEGIFDMNRSLPLPLVIQRIAVISSETAAGYEDFVNHLEVNNYGIRFYHRLFKAYVQGEQAEQSIISALDEIFKVHEQFDVVVIIRGGGSKTDLSVFDSYELAANVAQFPLPVITGIGHTRDESVVDMVANLSLKTPTAVADFIVERASDFLGELGLLHSRLTKAVSYFITSQKLDLNNLYSTVREKAKGYLWSQRYSLEQINSKLYNATKLPLRQKQNLMLLRQRLLYAQRSFFDQRRRELQTTRDMILQKIKDRIDRDKNMLERLRLKIESNDPGLILSRGYSITLRNGKLLTSIQDLSQGDEIITVLKDGRAVSEVKKKIEE